MSQPREQHQPSLIEKGLRTTLHGILYDTPNQSPVQRRTSTSQTPQPESSPLKCSSEIVQPTVATPASQRSRFSASPSTPLPAVKVSPVCCWDLNKI